MLPPSERLAEASAAMRRLMTAEAAAAPAQASEPGWDLRLAAFETAGRELGQLALGGQLQRGLRAILAHHLIFTFNRAGLAASEQSALSYLAKEVVMQHPIVSNPGPAGGPAGGAASVGQTGTTIAPATIDDEAARLRAGLTAQLRERGSIRTARIAEAFAPPLPGTCSSRTPLSLRPTPTNRSSPSTPAPAWRSPPHHSPASSR